MTSAAAFDGMYSQLEEERDPGPDAGRGAHPVSPAHVSLRPGSPGPYRLATICLAALCAVLLISIIAVSTHYKNKAQAGGEGPSEVQQQTQEANISALTAAIDTLQTERKQLQREKDELLAKLAAKMATEGSRLTQPTQPTPTPVCPEAWQLFNGSCYFISVLLRDWAESQSFCQSKGAHLAIIHTAEEQTFLWNLLPRGHWKAYWFGITDEHTEDHWKWVDGTPLVGGFWEDGEPNNHINEDCGYIVKTRVMTRVATKSWYDAPCTMDLPHICEKELGAGASTAIPH